MALSGQVARLWEAPRFRVEGPEKVLSLPLPGLRPPRALLPAGLRDGCLTWQSQCGYEGLNWTTPPPAQNSPTDAQCSENKTQALLSDPVSDRLALSSPLPTSGHADSLCTCTPDAAALPTAVRVRVRVCVCVCVTCSCTKRRPASVALPHHPLWTTARAPPSPPPYCLYSSHRCRRGLALPPSSPSRLPIHGGGIFVLFSPVPTMPARCLA